ncbi:MAG: hypothetical protein BZ133_00305 [Methanosphaera sp. SHI613]|jgi:hypothetical protein|nr:MAG: hypothetical protein BZ133_00305 [Methanosphaera sp. SHI613]
MVLMMNILLLWIVMIITETILFSTIYHLISSEYFVKKTNIHIFLKQGKTKDNDYLTLLLSLFTPLMLVSSGMFIQLFIGENHLSTASFMFGIYYIYFLIGIIYRIRFFKYIDEKKDNQYMFRYPYICSYLNLIYNLINVMLMIFYFVLKIPYSEYCWIFWLIYIHLVIIFPDYVNKYLPKDIHAKDGFNYYLQITSFPGSIIIIIILLFANQSPLL